MMNMLFPSRTRESGWRPFPDNAHLRRWRFGRLAWMPLGAIAVGLLWFLYQKTLPAGPAARATVEEQLRLVHQTDSDWNVDIMRSKMGLNASYDPIVSSSHKIDALLTRLEGFEGASDASVNGQLHAMRSLFEKKAELVDQFKSHNSVLRNSLRFLPTAAREAVGILSSPLAAEVNVTFAEALNYAVVIDDAQRDQLDGAVTHLRIEFDALPISSPAREPLGVFLSHAQTVQTRIGNEANLLAGIMAVPIVAAIDSTAVAFDAYFSASSRESEFWRKVLIAYSALLLLAVAITATRLRHSYRQINGMNAALVAANDSLEQRVEDRTRELADALASLRESEAQLIQSEKMSSLGQMVAGVAHEINTPLAYVRSSLETIGEQIGEVNDLVRHGSAMLRSITEPEPDPDRVAREFAAFSELATSFADHGVADELDRLASDSLHGVDQISEIVVNLRNFCRLDRSKATLFDLREGLDSTLAIARGAIGPHQVFKQYADVPDVVCAPSQINQVFLNLITNAAQALGERAGGAITLSTMVDGDMVRVDIADNGDGIEPQHLPRIFDPFFTTKPIGKGTGLGLSIAYKIVQEHGGHITVQSTPGQGTIFSVHLPCNGPPHQDLEGALA